MRDFFAYSLLFIADLLRDSMRMRRPASLGILLMDCAGRAMVASHCNVCLIRCLYILHSDAVNMFDLKHDPYQLCILQQCFGFLRHFYPVLWMT